MPAAPNAMQRATAATLKATSADAFDPAFAKAKRKGYLLAIAASNKESSTGADSAVVSYVKTYTTIATMHLNMANAEIAAQGASLPKSVNAGSGGLLSAGSSTSTWTLGFGAGLVLVAASSTQLVRRRRAVTAA